MVEKLLAPREAANILGISYPTLKQWIYHGKIKSVKTAGGHHRVPESEIDRMFPKKLHRGDIKTRRGNFRKISGRNQLIGRVVAIKFSGLLAQVTLAIGEQHMTSIITADAAKERSEEHTSELQSRLHLVCRLLLEKKKQNEQTRTRRVVESCELLDGRLT